LIHTKRTTKTGVATFRSRFHRVLPEAKKRGVALRERVRTLATDGRYELFKTTTKYDGKVGREQHHDPPPEKLPA
jgi:hypothetical protein